MKLNRDQKLVSRIILKNVSRISYFFKAEVKQKRDEKREQAYKKAQEKEKLRLKELKENINKAKRRNKEAREERQYRLLLTIFGVFRQKYFFMN